MSPCIAIPSRCRGKSREICDRFVVLLILGTALFGSACATTSGALEQLLDGQAEIVDLTHPLNASTPVSPGGAPFQMAPMRSSDRDTTVNRFALADNSGTHVEAPARVVSTQTTVDRLPISQFLGRGVLIDVRESVKQDPGYRMNRKDLEQWESDHGPIPPEAIVLIYTGWEERWSDGGRYLNLDETGRPVFPGVGADAVEFLVRERRVQALGIDTFSLYLGSGDTPEQRLFLTTGKFHLNNLTGLGQLPPNDFTLVAVPMKLEGGGGAPARVLAIIPRKRTDVEPGKKKVEQESGMGAESEGAGMRTY